MLDIQTVFYSSREFKFSQKYSRLKLHRVQCTLLSTGSLPHTHSYLQMWILSGYPSSYSWIPEFNFVQIVQRFVQCRDLYNKPWYEPVMLLPLTVSCFLSNSLFKFFLPPHPHVSSLLCDI